MLLATIQEAVRDYYTAATLTDAKLNRLIASAVRFYSRYNPYLKEHSFATVADQEAYDLPSDYMPGTGMDVEYWPSGSLTAGLTAGTEWAWAIGREPAIYGLISLRVIADINQAEHIKYIRGYYWVENDQIFIMPSPSATSTTVYITYASAHALNVGETGYDTIPGQDLDIIVDLTLAEILKGQAMDAVGLPDYSEGLQWIRRSHVSQNVGSMVQELRQGCIDKYKTSAVMV